MKYGRKIKITIDHFIHVYHFLLDGAFEKKLTTLKMASFFFSRGVKSLLYKISSTSSNNLPSARPIDVVGECVAVNQELWVRITGSIFF